MIESLLAAAAIAVLVLMLLPVVSRARRASRSVACLSHLHNLDVAFQMYAQYNGNHLPIPGITQVPWEHSLIQYCSADMFVCPGDGVLAPGTNSSYDWRDTGVPTTTLAGYGLNSSKRADAVLVFDSLPDWHEKSRMNVGLIDGSVQSMTYDDCVVDLATPIRTLATGS